MFFSWCLLLLVAASNLSWLGSAQAEYSYDSYQFGAESSNLRANDILREKAKLSGPELLKESIESANDVLETALQAKKKRNENYRADDVLKELEKKIEVAKMYTELLKERGTQNAQTN